MEGRTAIKMETAELSKPQLIGSLPAAGAAAEKFIKAGRVKKAAPVEAKV